MPNPPISIGELTDVPAPGSAIASLWAQEVSQRIVHRFADDAERATRYPAPIPGALSLVLARNYVEFWNGSRWQAIGAGSQLVPTYAAPSGTGSAGALRAGESSRAARFVIPYATQARFTYWLLIGATAAFSGRILLYDASAGAGGATYWTSYLQAGGLAALGGLGGPVTLPIGADDDAAAPLAAATPAATFGFAGILVPGLGAGQLVDVQIVNDAGSAGEIAWYLDQSNNRGYAMLDAG